MSVGIVDTGTANLASVRAAFERLGVESRPLREPEAVRNADHLVLPGVGSFGAAMGQLQAHRLVESLRERLTAGKPTLCVCVGLQVLAEGSEESPGARGLGLLHGYVTRIGRGSNLPIPQLGWNTVTASGSVAAGFAYHANSYALASAPVGWTASMSRYGAPFVAAIERGGILGCQFHPELSGAWGAALLARWLRGERYAGEPSALVPARAPLPRIIPCLDVRGGRVVKGVRFAHLRDVGDPAELAREYERQGADEIVMLDVSATLEARSARASTVDTVRRALGIPLTVGGGVKTVDDAKTLLDAGADKVSVNTAAVEDPSLLDALAARFGRQCVVLAIDACTTSSGWSVLVRAGRDRTGRDAVAWAQEGAERGAGEVLLTSFDRDGTRAGYDLALLRAVSQTVQVPLIASGGASNAGDLDAAARAGATGLLAASMFHDARATVSDWKGELASLGWEVRL